jgi:hypothetical protein
MLLYSIASLDERQLEAIQSLEKKLGKRILAFEGHNVELAELSQEDLDLIGKMETELRLSLVVLK